MCRSLSNNFFLIAQLRCFCYFQLIGLTLVHLGNPRGTCMTFHYNNNNQEPKGSFSNLLVVPYIDGKADIITKLRKLNYCAKPFESSYKNKLITKSLIFKTRFYVSISVVTATFLLTPKFVSSSYL